MSHFVLAGARLVTGTVDLPDAWVEVRGGRVQAVGTGADAPAEPPHVDARGLLLLPGLVDIHQHGGGGGTYAEGAGSATRAALFHRSRGTTTALASLVSAPVPVLADQVAALVPLVHEGLVAGIHLEGPWLNPARRGAHAAEALAVPGREDVDRLLRAGEGCVRMVTLAPELPGGPAAVEQLDAAGVVVAVGHTDATYDETREALRQGARVGTHLCNAMRPVHHREPGPVVALLESEAAVELVADGVHLHPSVLADLLALVGPGRGVLVTDAMAAAGMPDGRYRLGDRDVTVTDRVATGPDGQIAGSTVTLGEALRFAVTVAGVPLQPAVAAATLTPARLLGLLDVGDVVPGSHADLVLMTEELVVASVLHRGVWVGEAGV